MKKVINYFLFIIISFSICGCASQATSAEEYFSIGMAYFELKKFEEAEMWLNRARQADRTMTASTYNLGRLAFERQKYDEAAKYFEDILKLDPLNVHALRAASYTRIKTGELEIADMHYAKLLTLVPESSDDGYNHALVLFAMERYSGAQEVLEKYPFALLDNKDVMLLYARILNKQDKIEAIDCYAAWLNNYPDSKVRYEYAGILEQYKYYARAIEEYRSSLSGITASSVDPRRNEVLFAVARAVLTADSTDIKGIEELEAAVEGGFKDIEAVQALTGIENLSQANLVSINNIIDKLKGEAKNEEEPEVSENDSESSSQL